MHHMTTADSFLLRVVVNNYKIRHWSLLAHTTNLATANRSTLLFNSATLSCIISTMQSKQWPTIFSTQA